jgi:phage shock protein B
MDANLTPVFVVLAIFVGLPWVILHYVTRWKTSASLTTDDEVLLDELYQLARRLDARMDTVERLVSADNPDFQPGRVVHDRETDNQPLREIEQIRSTKSHSGNGRKDR